MSRKKYQSFSFGYGESRMDFQILLSKAWLGEKEVSDEWGWCQSRYGCNRYVKTYRCIDVGGEEYEAGIECYYCFKSSYAVCRDETRILVNSVDEARRLQRGY